MRVSFRLTLLAVLVGLVLATSAITAWISYGHGRVTAEELSRQLLEQTSKRVEQRVRHLLERAALQAELLRRLLESGQLPAGDLPGVARYLAEAIEAEAELSYLSYGREEDGAYVHAYRDREGAITLRLLHPEDGSLTLEDYRLDARKELELLRRERDRDENDPRGRPYYRAAVEADGATWTETYVFIGGDAELFAQDGPHDGGG